VENDGLWKEILKPRYGTWRNLNKFDTVRKA